MDTRFLLSALPVRPIYVMWYSHIGHCSRCWRLGWHREGSKQLPKMETARSSEASLGLPSDKLRTVTPKKALMSILLNCHKSLQCHLPYHVQQCTDSRIGDWTFVCCPSLNTKNARCLAGTSCLQMVLDFYMVQWCMAEVSVIAVDPLKLNCISSSICPPPPRTQTYNRTFSLLYFSL